LGILSDFERRLERGIEGIFAKAFRTGLHPVELATRILRDMEAGKTVGVRTVWVPNHFVFHIAPADADRFAQTEKALTRELEQVVRDGARERGWGLVGPPQVEFETDPDVREGSFECDAALVGGTIGTGQPLAPGQLPAADADPSPAEIVPMQDAGPGAPIGLTKDRTVIGRLPESDVVVDDPGASRRHAEIRRENGEFVLADLGSTNGTMVNESTVGEHVLQDGDRITIGKAVLEFRRR
jgi:hypothetical protein